MLSTSNPDHPTLAKHESVSAQPQPLGCGVTPAPNIKQLLAGADTAVVALDLINLEDDTYCFRDDVEACEPESLIEDEGVVDASSGHAIVLIKSASDSDYQVLNGRRRLLGMRGNPAIRQVKCKVVTVTTPEVATIFAAEANLDHGQPLTLAEKRRCFLAEHQALLDGGYEMPSKREFARRYGVAPVTPSNWLASIQGHAHDETGGVQNEHLGQHDANPIADMSPAAPFAGVQNEHSPETSPADGTGAHESETDNSKPVLAPVNPAEALEALRYSVEIVELLTPQRLAPHVNELRDLHQRLGIVLQSCPPVMEDAA